jgi:hypothetical protein
MSITLVDGDSTETYDTLEEAVAAAKTWYSNLEKDGFKLPPWDYQVRNFNCLLNAIADYNTRLAAARGENRDPFQAGFRLRAAETWWGSKNH